MRNITSEAVFIYFNSTSSSSDGDEAVLVKYFVKKTPYAR